MQIYPCIYIPHGIHTLLVSKCLLVIGALPVPGSLLVSSTVLQVSSWSMTHPYTGSNGPFKSTFLVTSSWSLSTSPNSENLNSSQVATMQNQMDKQYMQIAHTQYTYRYMEMTIALNKKK